MLCTINCKLCNKEFNRQLSPSNISSGKGKYCSRECSTKAWRINFNNKKIIPYYDGLKKGRTKGKIFTQEHKKKISKSLFGKKKENSRNWKGGLTLKNARNSFLIKIWRTLVFTRDNFTCQICGNIGCFLNAHHIKMYSKFIAERYRPDNGITLCKTCHKSLRGKEDEWLSYFIFNIETRKL